MSYTNYLFEDLKLPSLEKVQNWFEKFNQTSKKLNHWTLEKVDINTLSKSYIKKMNLNIHDNIYMICKDGQQMSKEFFHANIYCTKQEDFDKQKYLVLQHLVKDKYSNDTVKSCNLKSPYRFKSQLCVFDKDTCEIIFENTNEFDGYIKVHDNVVISYDRSIHSKITFFNLNSRSIIHEIENGGCETWEGQDVLYVRTPKYGKTKEVFIINYHTGYLRHLEKNV